MIRSHIILHTELIELFPICTLIHVNKYDRCVSVSSLWQLYVYTYRTVSEN